MSDEGIDEPPLSLLIERVVPAQPVRVFEAWTNADELKQWWGPAGVRCLSAEIDLQIGGKYRIANELPDGNVLWISGEFEVIERPRLLTYTWTVENESPTVERVTVRFNVHADGTMIGLQHERIPSTALRDRHQQGWHGCLDGLHAFIDG